METTRRAIRQGRLLAAEGLYAHALDTWKAALGGAYSQQDLAALFVLSCNVGEACVAQSQATDGAQAAQLLREAQESLDYALQVVEQCSLRGVIGGYRTLYRGVRRAEALRRKAAQLAGELQRAEEEEEGEEKEKKEEKGEEELVCTTCGGAGGELEVVLDENDGYFYCRKCYDDYYGAVGVEVCGGEEEDDDEEEVAADGDIDEVVETEVGVAETHEVAGAFDDGGDVDRVEAGEEMASLDNADNDGLVTETEGGSEVESGAVSEPAEISTGDRKQDRIRCRYRYRFRPPAVSKKLEYSIAELLELRKQSPTDCPAALLSSPARDDGTAPTPARHKATTNSNSRKKSSAKKPVRSSVAPKQSKIEAATQVEKPENDVSPLPTLELCNTMRTALQERQKTSANIHCNSSGVLDFDLSCASAAHFRLAAEREQTA
ncbi:Cell differentiation protein RCD1 [Phytophthora cinnamomi]|uniref:Cell differentiation protein RCD1 n=1 Tax=Phytophthora cinnamomi TaxID=4785 RepID=UPI00355A5D56|nr:Cell differentiation protein RCD1 [Phytophthora cinnamomi]